MNLSEQMEKNIEALKKHEAEKNTVRVLNPEIYEAEVELSVEKDKPPYKFNGIVVEVSSHE